MTRWGLLLALLPVLDLAGRADAGLIPTPGEDHAQYQATRAAAVARLLEALPGVHEAHVMLELPPREASAWPPLDETSAGPAAEAGGASRGDAPTGTASVIVLLEPGASPPGADIARLVAGAAPVAPTAVRVEFVPTGQGPGQGPPLSRLAKVGPFAVEPASRGPLLWTLGGAAVAVLVMAIIVVVLWMQKGRPVPPGRRE
ncbi:MAG: hypothetical protein IT370_06985 [Deltaproteobacteria bacterium]|nr:hypothetical protein [Deltaproteobacteria bacterium]